MLHYLQLLIYISLPYLLRLAKGISWKYGTVNVLEIQIVMFLGIVLVIHKFIMYFSQVSERSKWGIEEVRKSSFAVTISSQDFVSFVFLFLVHTDASLCLFVSLIWIM